MDSDRTQDALDALADLFLTGLDTGGATDAPEPAAPAATAERKPLRRAADAALDGPPPIRLAPNLKPPRPQPTRRHAPHPGEAASAAGPSVERSTELSPAPPPPAEQPYLRLRRATEADDDAADQAVAIAPVVHGGNGSSRADQPAASPEPTDQRDHEDDADRRPPHPVLVEAALLANLPGVGGPWLTQYAQLLASQDGPVAVLRVGEDEVDAELVLPQEADAPPPPAGADLVALLRSLVARDASPVRTILVHVDTPTEPAAAERLLQLDHWSVLCGADDAAVVSVYRLLKQLVDADGATARMHVGVMLMGSDEAMSRAAFGRIRAAAEDFLHTPVQLVGWQKRLGPANVHRLGAYAGGDDLWPRLRAFFETLTPPELVPDEGPIGEAAIGEAASGAGPSAPERPAPTPPREPATHVLPRSSIRAEAFPGRQYADAAPRRPAPGPVPEFAPQPAPAPVAPELDPPDLAQFLTTGPRGIPGGLSGGVALDARCPQHPHTQFVLDQAGRLHLLRSVQSPESKVQSRDSGLWTQDSGLDALRAAILDLIEVRRWVNEHLALLQLTQRQLRIDADAEPMLHLFTDRADLATGLVARLGGTLKLHLLQPIRVGAHATWFSTPLS